MNVRWPLSVWKNEVGVSSITRRESVLGGNFGDANQTNLGALRRFVASLERWPDSAVVTKHSGAVIGVEFFSRADPLASNEKPQSAEEATQ